MRRSRKRIALRAAALVPAAAVALLVTVGASAHDGRGGRDGDRSAVQTRTHVQVVHQHAQRRDGRDDEDGGQPVLSSTLAPSVPTDPAVHGVVAGGLPWVLKRGTVQLKADGRIHVKIQGLVIPVAHAPFPANTARPVTVVSASLYCAPDASGAAATTQSVPISEDGNATIDETIALPATCLAPIVLIHPNNAAGAYIALTGWRP